MVQVLAKVNKSLELLIFSRPSTIHLWYVCLKYFWICILKFFSCSSMVWLDFSKCDFPAFFLFCLMPSRCVLISFWIWMFLCFPRSYLISSGLVLFNVLVFFVIWSGSIAMCTVALNPLYFSLKRKFYFGCHRQILVKMFSAIFASPSFHIDM